MQLHSVSEKSCAPAEQGKAQHTLVHANGREAPRVWGAEMGLPSHCWEAAHSAMPCPSKRHPSHICSLLRGWHSPPQSMESSPPLQKAATSPMYV